MVNTVVSENCGSDEKPPFAAKTARSSALVPIAIAGRGVRSLRVEIIPNGILSRPKCESGATGSQDSDRVSKVSKDMASGGRGGAERAESVEIEMEMEMEREVEVEVGSSWWRLWASWTVDGGDMYATSRGQR